MIAGASTPTGRASDSTTSARVAWARRGVPRSADHARRSDRVDAEVEIGLRRTAPRPSANAVSSGTKPAAQASCPAAPSPAATATPPASAPARAPARAIQPSSTAASRIASVGTRRAWKCCQDGRSSAIARPSPAASATSAVVLRLSASARRPPSSIGSARIARATAKVSRGGVRSTRNPAGMTATAKASDIAANAPPIPSAPPPAESTPPTRSTRLAAAAISTGSAAQSRTARARCSDTERHVVRAATLMLRARGRPRPRGRARAPAARPPGAPAAVPAGRIRCRSKPGQDPGC